MRCVYFNKEKDECSANIKEPPPEFYKPDGDDRIYYCESKYFKSCPRFTSVPTSSTPAPNPSNAATSSANPATKTPSHKPEQDSS